ncbi:MAG TPA: ribonuclease HII [Candidatus Nitrosotalea sp.]|nr:ribonuclease HII [Nitrososphaerota archaeon]HKU33778.1 ribonuclease HII [Candidatus Nitrosotalea sp.]
MLVCGVDDAGRGSAIGPLVIAGIRIERNKIKLLSEIGVKDSKQLTPRARENLYKKILALVDDYYVARISPRIIDQSVQKNQLNHLEGKYMAKVIAKLRPDSAYVDSCDVNPVRFGLLISKLAKVEKVHSSHHADRRFPVVSAASIIAKVNRDRAIEKIRKNFDVGSGYPSDPKTMRFIKASIASNGMPPKFVRKSWKPVKILLGV